MSHRPAWLCPDCRHQLGVFVDGAVIVWVPKPAIGPDAVAVSCPRCDRVVTWKRQVETPALG